MKRTLDCLAAFRLFRIRIMSEYDHLGIEKDIRIEAQLGDVDAKIQRLLDLQMQLQTLQSESYQQ